ncbi:LINC01664 isoform 1 [Pan troglodytes]|uniref:LINC01664 isoform 1 n=1 Tax=Pan troglodytes TaxID=9598 RepID=A0A2J8Q1X3_PANTR|nr:LINC01664 isoform 1 [Pan troglodytes]
MQGRRGVVVVQVVVVRAAGCAAPTAPAVLGEEDGPAHHHHQTVLYHGTETMKSETANRRDCCIVTEKLMDELNSKLDTTESLTVSPRLKCSGVILLQPPLSGFK